MISLGGQAVADLTPMRLTISLFIQLLDYFEIVFLPFNFCSLKFSLVYEFKLCFCLAKFRILNLELRDSLQGVLWKGSWRPLGTQCRWQRNSFAVSG